MKKIKNKIAALVCGLALLCGVTYIATANNNPNELTYYDIGSCSHYIFEGCGAKVFGMVCGGTSGTRQNHALAVIELVCN